MEHDQGFMRSHWTLPSGECTHCIAPATAMVIVACVALSIMVSNHLVMPLLLRAARTGDPDLAEVERWVPECEPKNGKKVAIVGAGPAGLEAALCALSAEAVSPVNAE